MDDDPLAERLAVVLAREVVVERAERPVAERAAPVSSVLACGQLDRAASRVRAARVDL